MKTALSRHPWMALLILASLAAAGVALAQNFPFVRIHDLSETVAPPQILTVTTTPQTVFVSNPSRTDGRVLMRTIQNVGTIAVLYAINATAATTNYHGIIAGGVNQRDGLGSVVDLGRVRGSISVVTEAGTSTICLTEQTQ